MSDASLQLVILISLALLLVAACLAFFRMIKGPQLTDRMIALDLTSMVLLGSVMITAVYWKNPLFLDASIILAMVGFLATVGISRFLERRRVK
ncbi:MAG: monovalent cation/H+ antiporter complex subunit F [Acidobacteriota bacterium]|nr:monovalent cation/H+ antiporter complex subunit F [Acidobacteriota bacterium]